MRRRRDVEKEPIDVSALSAAWESRTPAHSPRFEQQEFPFWKLTLAIATAIVLAVALIWTVMEVRARYELQAFTLQLEADTRRWEAEARKQDAALKIQVDQQAQARRAEASRRASVSTQRGTSAARFVPLMSQGTTAMPAGSIACMFGYQSQRQSSGAWKQLLIDGKAQPCRTG